tara:strand:- start:353 stop:640 length:288 start_codon:yes stop_codon:yes gene_type:complete
MALPTKANVQTLDYVGLDGPFVSVAAKGTETEAVGLNGLIFVLSAGAVADPTNVVYIKTGASTWSTATNIYIKTDGTTWTEVDDFYIKTDSGWNS